ncbi:MAG: NAD(P)/FAD-dependent oxidoreductase [Candidatus Omnitrophica bacterium]|nr:NAD(P)/FAD-dependent oxidoreductase [Candidatus Omnitrophota bacterium]
MNKKYDVIIIGSGIGGLAVAGLLAEKKKVLVLEKNRPLGGYCASFKRGDYLFESAVQAINGLYKGSPIYDILKRTSALSATEIESPKELYRSIFPDYDITIPQKDLAKYKKMLFSFFPREKENIESLFSVMESLYMEMRRFYLGEAPKKSPFILRYYKRSLRDLLDEFIKDDKLKAIISQYWMYRGLPPSKLSAITFSYIWYDYTANGSYFPRGGMEDIIKSMTDFIRKSGGDVMIGCEVAKIHVEKGEASGVELKNGDRFSADSVVSGIDVFGTFAMIDGAEKTAIAPFLKKLKENAISISAFKVYLGLDVDVRSLGVKDYEIFVNPSYDMESMYRSSVDNDFQDAPYSITIYSNLSGAFCGKGKSAVSIGMLSGYDFWKGLSRTEYKKNKEEALETLLGRAEKIIPGLRKHIKVKIAGTPLTMERYTGNSQGSIYGWNRKNLADEMQFINPTTPIKNLMLASHWTKMGGGIGGVLLSSDRVSNLLKG